MAQIIPIDDALYGARQEEWAQLDVLAGLTEDLLPVVSNPHATISPNSSIRDIGKLPSTYNSQRHVVGFAGWTQHKATGDDITKWSSEKDYGICIQTRNVRAIDVDVTDSEEAEEIYNAINRSLPKRYRNNSSKFLLAFRLAGIYAKRKITTKHGIIEFLANGQQFVACGRHPSGVRYEWDGGLPEDFPELSSDEFESLWQSLIDLFAVETSSASVTTTRHEVLSNVFDKDPISKFLIDNGMIARADKDGKLHLAHCPWEDDHSDGQTALTSATYFPANTHGYANGAYVCQHAHCQDRTKQQFLDAIGYVQDVADDFEDLTQDEVDPGQPTPSDLKFRFKSHEEFVSHRVHTEWFIKNLLPKAGLGVIFGESASGKSFMVLDLAYAIAHGLPWRGIKTTQARVGYVAAEGTNGVRKRLIALAQHNNIKRTEIHVLDSPPNMLEQSDAVELAKAVKAQAIDLIIIDTMAQVMPGANENSGEDVGKVIKYCRRIHETTGAMVMFVHHSGKDSTRGARGWSGLRAACDVEIEITRSDEQRAMRISKQKDGEDGAEYGFKLLTVNIGLDEDNEVITSCVVEHCDELPTKSKSVERKGTRIRAIETAFNDLVGLDGLVLRTDVEAAAATATNNRERNMRSTMDNLIKQGVFIEEGLNIRRG